MTTSISAFNCQKVLLAKATAANELQVATRDKGAQPWTDDCREQNVDEVSKSFQGDE